jgi:hypothetical protein
MLWKEAAHLMTDLPPHSPPTGPSPLPGSPPYGGPLVGSPRRRIGRPLVITGVVALVVGAGAGVAAAVTGSSSPSQSASSPPNAAPAPTASPGHRFHGPGFGGRFFGGGAGPLGAVHGQFVVPKQGGGYQTIDTQRGQVTAVSTSAITIKSSDGYAKTYAVTSSTIVDARRDGIGSVKVGDQATVTATASGATATAANITDLSNLQGLRQQFFGGNGPQAPSTGAPSTGGASTG